MGKEKPIATIRIREDVSKMTTQQRNRLLNWIQNQNYSLERDYVKYGKCVFNLFEVAPRYKKLPRGKK